MEKLEAGEGTKVVVVGSTPSWETTTAGRLTGTMLYIHPLSKGAIPPMKVRRVRLNLLLHNRQQDF